MDNKMLITKTDFMLYLEAPKHLWAKKHDQLEQIVPGPFEIHLMEQGRHIEDLAAQYLAERKREIGQALELSRRKTYTVDQYQAEVDVLVYDPGEKVFDAYEIKSSAGVSKEHGYDVTFQYLIYREILPIRHFYLVHINREYERAGEIQLKHLFVETCLDDEIAEMEDEILTAREDAWRTINRSDAQAIPNCARPGGCPCPRLCHPLLPEYPIYDVPRLQTEKARDLSESGIHDITRIPDSFPLSAKQKKYVEAAKKGNAIIEIDNIAREMAKLEYPLYFLDYETYNPGVPWYEGYKPYQHIVFQYSLHILAEEDDELEHVEFLGTKNVDPGLELLNHLDKHIGRAGSVIVWYKAFETGRNKDLARMYPQYDEMLANVNQRVYDLMEVFRKGYYLHPDFHGSASIKSVLPVLVEDLNYDLLPISQGEEAMLAWVKLMDETLDEEEEHITREDLLRYCEMDTLAMVRIWEVLNKLVSGRG